MGLLTRIFGETRDRSALLPLYRAIVAEARRPAWYEAARVPDTIDGRFDMVVLVLALVLLRLEREGEAGKLPSVLLTEVFIDDMDSTMREIGFGDLVVGKRVGGMMSALGGRLGAYRDADRRAALVRNVYRDAAPDDEAVATAVAMSDALQAQVDATPLDRLLGGAVA